QNLVVKVWDPTSDGPQPRGKQVKNPEGIWYTPVTGIWQTVWLEPVNEKHIKDLRTTPNIDKEIVTIDPILKDAQYGDIIEVTIKDGDKVLSVSKANATEVLEIPIAKQKLWTPESPFLYHMTVKLISDGTTVDQVESYFAM